MERAKKWIPAIMVMVLIFIISSIPGQVINAVGLGDEDLHINGHFILFFILCLLLYKPTRNIPHTIVISLIYAISDELHQLYVPLRSASMFDVCTDTLGILLAGVFLWKILPYLPNRFKNYLS